MKKLIVCMMLFTSMFTYSQIFSIDDHFIELSDYASVENFSENTYFNTLDSLQVSYEIILDSIPMEWDFQNCFPTCHPINTYFTEFLSLPPDSSVYLNGHFYPNNTPGEGILKMELSINHGLYLDTVVWHAIAETSSNINEQINNNQEIEYIIDLNGKIIKEISNNRNVIIKYKNGDSKMILILH